MASAPGPLYWEFLPRYSDSLFFQDHDAPGDKRAIRQSTEVMRLNIAQLDSNRAELAAWFGRGGQRCFNLVGVQVSPVAPFYATQNAR